MDVVGLELGRGTAVAATRRRGGPHTTLLRTPVVPGAPAVTLRWLLAEVESRNRRRPTVVGLTQRRLAEALGGRESRILVVPRPVALAVGSGIGSDGDTVAVLEAAGHRLRLSAVRGRGVVGWRRFEGAGPWQPDEVLEALVDLEGDVGRCASVVVVGTGRELLAQRLEASRWVARVADAPLAAAAAGTATVALERLPATRGRASAHRPVTTAPPPQPCAVDMEAPPPRRVLAGVVAALLLVTGGTVTSMAGRFSVSVVAEGPEAGAGMPSRPLPGPSPPGAASDPGREPGAGVAPTSGEAPAAPVGTGPAALPTTVRAAAGTTAGLAPTPTVVPPATTPDEPASSTLATDFSRPLVFSAAAGGKVPKLWLALRDGSFRQLTTGDAADTYPTVSPDSQWVAFQRDEHNGEIYIVKTDGSREIRITAGRDSLDAEPNWASANEVVYASNDGTGVEGADIFAYNLATGQRRVVVHDPTSDDRTPAWGSQGQRLAWAANGRTGQYEIVVRNSLVGVPVTVAPSDDGARRWRPAFSPDDNRIAFQVSPCRGCAGDDDLYVVSAWGGTATPITAGRAGHDRYPSWGPTDRIAFSSDRAGNGFGLWSVRPDGSDLRPIEGTSGWGTGQPCT